MVGEKQTFSKNAQRFQVNPWYDKPKGEFVADPHYKRKGEWEPYDLVKFIMSRI